MNDFAHFWGFSDSDIEKTVASLKKRRIRKIDLGCIRYVNKKGEKCRRYFLNCINIGLIAAIMNLRRKTIISSVHVPVVSLFLHPDDIPASGL